ncbi:hypothetical protein KKF84_11385, partial [Myxococcota bacterium]|nr:hypothetical protein [Myxococcota bacterium]
LETLRTAEYSWQKEIDEWGFYAPPIVSAEGKYLIYLGYAGGAAGYTAPIGTVPETAWDDCATYIVIESGLELWSIGDTVSHELSHATQGAMDCMEPVTFWENTAVFVEMAVFPESMSNNRWFSYYFQISPHLSISEGQSPYWYGGYIWPTFLADFYGEGWNDVPFIREVWEMSMQESGDSSNSIDYMEAIDEKLSQTGHSLLEAFHRFSVSRWFVDSRYVEGVSSMPFGDMIYPVPPIIATLDMDFPTVVTPPEASWPKQYGVNYYVIRNPEGYDRTTRISVSTFEEGIPLAVQIVPMESPLDAITKESTGLKTVVDFDPSETGDVLVVVAHLGGDNFNPNGVASHGVKYSLMIQPAVPLPFISMVSPGVFTQGGEHVMRIYGADFQEGAQISFLPANGIVVESAALDQSGVLVATVSVPDDALTGHLTVVVTNPDGGSDSMENAVIVEPGQPSTGGGGCSTGRGAPEFVPLWILFAGIFLVRRRVKTRTR